MRLKGISLSIKYHEDPLVIRANPLPLLRSFNHILISIIKAFEKQEGNKTINVSTEKINDKGVVSIQDTFRLFNGDINNKVLFNFRRSELKSFGFPLAFQLFEDEGGKVSYEDKEEGGFFQLSIPLNPYLPKDSKKTRRVLVVDDDEIVLEVIGQYLELLGIEMFLTPSPLEALRVLSDEVFEIIIVDFKMPEMNGIDFINKVCESSSANRFILMTGNVFLFNQKLLKEDLKISVIDKPLSLMKLKHAISELFHEEERNI